MATLHSLVDISVTLNTCMIVELYTYDHGMLANSSIHEHLADPVESDVQLP